MPDQALEAFISSLTVIVIGGAGYVGSHLVRRLAERGASIICVDPEDPPERLPGVTYYATRISKIRPSELVGRVSTDLAVIHLATTDASVTEDTSVDQSDIEELRAALELAAMLRAGHFLFISSAAVYSSDPNGSYSAYARRKAAAERLAREWRSDRLCVQVVRPFNIIGCDSGLYTAQLFRRPRLASAVLRHLARESPSLVLRRMGAGPEAQYPTRNFVLVGKVAVDLCDLIGSPTIPDVINIASPASVTLDVIAGRLASSDFDCRIDWRPMFEGEILDSAGPPGATGRLDDGSAQFFRGLNQELVAMRYWRALPRQLG